MVRDIESIWADIEKNIQWKRIHKTMLHLGWEWYNGGYFGVPAIRTMKKEVRHLVESCLVEGANETSGGGFRVIKSDGEIYVTFELATASSLIEEPLW